MHDPQLELVSCPASDSDNFCLAHWPTYNADSGIAWSYRRGGLVASRAGRPVGALTYSHCGGVAHLGQVVVDPSQLLRGVARQLVAACEREAIAAGCHLLTAEVADFHPLGFFTKMEFRVVATFENEKFGRTWVRLEKALPR